MEKTRSIDAMIDKYRAFRNASVKLGLESINNKELDRETRDTVQGAMELVMDIANDIIDDLKKLKEI